MWPKNPIRVVAGWFAGLLEGERSAAGNSRADLRRRPTARPTGRGTDRGAAGGTSAARSATGARMEILNLSMLAEEFADRWPELSEKVDQLVAATLKRRLGPDDSHAKCGDAMYAIVFADLAEPEAKQLCAAMADELLEKLLGRRPNSAGLAVATATKPLPRPDAPPSAATLAELGQSLDGIVPDVVGEPAAAQGSRRVSLQKFEALLRAADDDLGGYQEGTAQGAAAPQFAPVPRPGRSGWNVQEVLDDYDEHIEALEWDAQAAHEGLSRLIQRAESELETRTRLHASVFDPASLDLAQVVFQYKAIWQPQLAAVVGYQCIPTLEIGGRQLTGDAMLPIDPPRGLVAVLDRLVLRRAVIDIRELLQHQHRTTIAIQVHHSTLNRLGSRAEFLTICSLIDPEVRRCILWELVEPAMGYNSSQLPPVITLLRKYGRVVVVRTGLGQVNFQELARMGVHAVGGNLADIDELELAGARHLSLFHARAKRHRLRVYLGGIESSAQAATVAEAGFDYLWGPAVAPKSTLPGRGEAETVGV